MMNKEELIFDFKENSLTLTNLIKKYGVEKEIIKGLLKEELKEDYSKILFRNIGRSGNRALMEKLRENPEFRQNYFRKTGNGISKAILEKMKDENYRKKWIEKTKHASVLGRQQVNLLLETNPIFKEAWIKNCKKGGEITFNAKLGAYDPKNREKRKIGSLKGLKSTTRKVLGPKGESMYNKLEVSVARVILRQKLNYIYEKRFCVDNQNGYISCDFVLNLNKIVVIEATCWDKVEEKCKRFIQKRKYLEALFGSNFELIVVVPERRLKEKYSIFLKNIPILLVAELGDYLKRVAGVGFEPTAFGL